MANTDLSIKTLFNVEGKIVLVTGGGGGIGEMISRGFVQNGAKVYISSRKAENCEKTAARLTALGPGKCIALGSGDLSIVENTKKLADQIESLEGKLDILVNNSGATWGESLENTSEKGWDRVYNLNVKGLFFVTKHFVPLLQKASKPNEPSRIINIASIAGLRPAALPTFAYNSSKSAVLMLTKHLAGQLAPAITVNAVCPGLVPSNMTKGLLTSSKDELTKSTPLGRLGTAEDMFGIVAYFCGRSSAWVTGAHVVVDGGAVIATSQEAKI